MRKLFMSWLATIVFFRGWHVASYYDTGPTFFLSRQFHDQVYAFYGKILDIPPSEIPERIFWLLVVDTLIVLSIVALRYHKKWLPQTLSFIKQKLGIKTSTVSQDKINQVVSGQVHPAE